MLVLKSGNRKLIIWEGDAFFAFDIYTMKVTTRKYETPAELVNGCKDNLAEIIPGNQLKLVIERNGKG
jgi:hypothetical protein